MIPSFKTAFAALLLSAATVAPAIAQQPGSILEKDYDISRKAKRGYLGSVDRLDNGNFDMTYVLPSSARKVKYEIYHFDKDANLINTERDEIELERARLRWKWFTYKGDIYLTNTLSAGANLTGQLIFRKKIVTAKWNWWTGRYDRNVKMTDKIKPKDEDGKSYTHIGGSYEVERDSSVLVLGMPRSLAKAGNAYQAYDLIKCDNQGNPAVLQRLTFQNAMQPVFSGPLQDDQSEAIPNDDQPRDWILIMAPSKILSTKDNRGEPTAFQYLRISPEGTVKENFAFSAPAAGYRILNAYEKNGAVIVYGMSVGKDGKYVDQSLSAQIVPTTSATAGEQAAGNTDKGKSFGGITAAVNAFSGQDDLGMTQDQVDGILDEKKYTNFAFARFEGGKMAYGALTPMDEVNGKAVAPPDMKRPLKFDGNKFVVNNLQILSDGSMVLSVQDFKKIKRKDEDVRIYKGMYLMHFSGQGQLAHNYTVALDQRAKSGFFNRGLSSDMFPATSYIYESPDQARVNWVMHMAKSVDKDDAMPLYTIEYGTINPGAGQASDFKTLGEDEKRTYYLYPEHNTLVNGNYIYYFSETSRGDKMLISRMNL